MPPPPLAWHGKLEYNLSSSEEIHTKHRSTYMYMPYIEIVAYVGKIEDYKKRVKVFFYNFNYGHLILEVYLEKTRISELTNASRL